MIGSAAKVSDTSMREAGRNEGWGGWRDVVAAFLLAPFFVLALLPAAAMPARSADGLLTLVLCGEGGPADPGGESGDVPQERCAWAAAHAAGAVLPVPAALSAPDIRVEPVRLTEGTQWEPSREPGAATARGPPLPV